MIQRHAVTADTTNPWNTASLIVSSETLFILIDTLINKITVATWAQVMYIQVYETQLWNLESFFDNKKNMIIQNKQNADQSDIF